MSQFLNQVQSVQPREASDLSGIDTSHIARSLKQAGDSIPEPSTHGNGDSLTGLLDGLLDANSAAVQLAESRLQNCRRFEIPRTCSKLMFPDSAIANSSVAESYKSLRTRLLRAQATTGIRTACISSAVPQEGKTLTSLNIGLCCAQLSSLRILLVDADLRTAGLSALMGLRTGPGLAEVLAGNAKYDETIASSTYRYLHLLPAGNAEAPAPELFAGTQWKELMSWGAEAFNLLIVDTPSILSVSDFELIAASCDATLVVVRPRRTSREALEKALEKVDRKKLLGTILNETETPQHSQGYGRYYQYGSYVRTTNPQQKKSESDSKSPPVETPQRDRSFKCEIGDACI